MRESNARMQKLALEQDLESLESAREATERGGEVMAIPGSPLDPRSSGCNILIREGATVVQNSKDIIECLVRPIKAGVSASGEWNGLLLFPDQRLISSIAAKSSLKDLAQSQPIFVVGSGGVMRQLPVSRLPYSSLNSLK